MSDPIQTPAAPPVAPAIGGLLASILAAIPQDQLALLSKDLGIVIGEAIRPILAEEIDKAFKQFRDTMEVSKPNDELQNELGALPGVHDL